MMSDLKKIVLIVILSVVMAISDFAQTPQPTLPLINGDQNPFGVKWYQIKTHQFTVIFPKEIEKDAQKVANTLNYVYPFVIQTSKDTKPINVILQSNLAESNGFSTLTPRRMEFYNTPPQNSFAGTVDWYSLLSIHEFRHITQFSRCDIGFTKFVHILFGNFYSELFMMSAMPPWFFEGDAVATETALTNSGRGRLPQFNVEMRSLLFAGKRYNYEKVFFGSYKNWYPLDASYSMGYQYVTFLRKKYGLLAMNKLVRNGSRKSWNPYAFGCAMRKITKKSPSKNYQFMLNELDSTWNKQLEGLTFTDAAIIIQPRKNDWTYNNFAKYTNDGNIIVNRYGQESNYQFVKINLQTKQEEKIYASNFINTDVPLSVSGDKMVWAETKNDIRWGNRSYSNIKMIDIHTGKKKNITHKSKFFAPALNPDGNQIVTVEFNNQNICSLLILDAETGKELKRFPNPENELIQTPVWSTDGKYIVYVKLHSHKGKTLCLLDPKTEITENLIDYSNENVAYPVCDGKYVYYDSPLSGIDNIYAISIETKNIYQVTSRKFGAYYPSVSVDGKKLLFSDACDEGYMVMEMPLDINNWTPISKIEKRMDNNYKILVKQEQGQSILDSIPNKEYKVTKYIGSSPLKNAYFWNFYSFYPSINLMIQTQNPLSSFGNSLAYNYNLNEHASCIDFNSSYAGFYPIIDFGGSIGKRASYFDTTFINNHSNVSFDTTLSYSWNEKSAYMGLKLPLNLSSGIYSSKLSFGVNVAFTEISDQNRPEADKNNNGNFVPITYSMDYIRETGWLRDMMPVWGQELHVSYAYTPLKGDYKGDLLSLQGLFYFPGIVKHHNLFFEVAYEKQNPVNYHFESKILYPRGYQFVFEKEIIKGTANYTFPIAYPDFSLIHTIYFKRFSANLFYDYGLSKNPKTTYYRSTGAEFKSETYLFHIPVPLIFGLRESYIFDGVDKNKCIFEGTFSLNY